MFPPPLSNITNFNFMIVTIVITTISGFGIIFADFFTRRTIIKKEIENKKACGLSRKNERSNSATNLYC